MRGSPVLQPGHPCLRRLTHPLGTLLLREKEDSHGLICKVSSEPEDSAGSPVSLELAFSQQIPEREKHERTWSPGLVLGDEGQNMSVLYNFLARAELASPQSGIVLMGRVGAIGGSGSRCLSSGLRVPTSNSEASYSSMGVGSGLAGPLSPKS